MAEPLLYWVTHYGYFAIFSLLVLGIVGLPVPDETLLTLCGYLVYRGNLHLTPTLLAAFLGSACGISISYFLGRTFGLALIHRYGKWIHMDDQKLHKVHDWFRRAGRWSLTVGYFIPGVRHFTAYVAGSSCLEIPVFAAFAYSGAAIWASTFVCLGYFLGDRWSKVSADIHRHMLLATGAAAVVLAGVWLWRRRHGRAAR